MYEEALFKYMDIVFTRFYFLILSSIEVCWCVRMSMVSGHWSQWRHLVSKYDTRGRFKIQEGLSLVSQIEAFITTWRINI